MEKDVRQKKDHFPKTASDVCRILARGKNWYGSKYNCFPETNDGLAFTTTSGDEQKKSKGKKKKHNMLQM